MVDLAEVLILKLSSTKPGGGPSLVTSLAILPGGHTHEGGSQRHVHRWWDRVPRADRRRF